MSDMTPEDRDLVVRTMIGEAANQPDEGLAAVAHVIMNRARSGKFGKSPRDVVLAKNQFEPWSTRGPELMSYAEDSPEYARASRALDAATAEGAQDPTGGATHFLNEKIVRERRGGSLPRWASGESKKIGDHTFYGGRPMASADDDLLTEFSRSAPRSTTATAAPGDELLTEYERAPVSETPSASGRARVNIPTEEIPRGTFTTKMVDAMPIVGPLAERGFAAVGAGVIEPGIDMIREMAGKKPLHKSTFSERYDENLEKQRQSNRLFEKEHPIQSVAADVAGPAMLFGGLAGGPLSVGAQRAGAMLTGAGQRVANAVQRVMGMRGASLGARVYQGAGGMGAVETTNQLLRGNDPREQGLLGPVPLAVVTGGLGPAIGEGIAAGGSKIMEMLPRRSGPLKDTNSITRNKLLDAYEGETPGSIAAAKDAYGREGMLMDVNQAGRDLGGGLADVPGPAKQEVRETLRVRAAGQGGRMEQSLDKNTVPHVDVRQLVKTIDTMQDAASKPLYDAFRATKVHPTDEIKGLIPRLEKAGAFKMADELAGIAGRPTTETFFTGGPNKAFPTAETWDYVKRGLDRRISTALDSGDKELSRELIKLKKEMIAEIEKTDGGKIWKKARETFAEHAEIKHQLEEGMKTFSRSTRVDDLAEELSLLSYNERAARQQGARDAVQHIIDNSLRGDTSARNQLLTKAGREKLELLFGEKKSARLIKDLEAELNMEHSRYAMVGNSETSSKQARRDALMPQRAEKGYLRSIDITRPGSLVPDWMTPQAIMEGQIAERTAASNAQLSRLLRTTMGSPEFDDLVSEIAAEGARRASNRASLGRAGTAAAGAIAASGSAQRNRLLRQPDESARSGGARR